MSSYPDLFYRILTSPLLLLGTLFAGLAVYISLVVVYRLTLHPLARYPGPPLARITDIHLAYHAYLGTRHLEFYRTHELYGPIVRIGPNTLSINTSTALKSIYGFKSNVKKSDFYDAFPVNKNAVNVHSTRDKKVHARKRRVLSHAFSDKALAELEKYILQNVRAGCRLLAEKSGERAVRGFSGEEKGEWTGEWNMANWCNWLVFDIMGDLVFGKAFGMLEGEGNRFAVDLVGNAAHRHLICGTHLTLHNYHLDKLLFRRIAANRTRYMAYSRTQATARTQLGLDTDRKDFFYHLLQARDPETGAGFSAPELWGESNLLIIAGSDTTSTALAGTFFYLTRNPHVLARLTEEIRGSFADVEDIVNGPALNSCAYLRACLDETLRMTPPVPGALPREVLPGGLELDGHHLPAGVVVGVPAYAIHHNEAYYPDSFRYLPERWLADPQQNPYVGRLEEAREAFCPFSVGPRGCIGRGLAYVELSVTVARVLFLFDVRAKRGETLGEGGREGVQGVEGVEGRERRGEYQIEDRFASRKDGPVVEFRVRG
ncbi:cytochrome P450 [Mytilinidion resinicola]|uniref:Cytochrome P450 n=1 Tax=Mytilinidion resinicola TaxID=574789 RepID=A0A6A6YLJ9_9PEZI|nr:cytochrome P450 [Mytilinidion resinicola]KAF2809419.1 cytochrome P450 [Mytilinidion resinicola]